MKPDFKKLCIAIYEFEDYINNYCKSIGNIKDIKEIIDLDFNDIITNHRYYDISDWKWQLINTIATPKMYVDEEINNLILELENSLLTIHNSNWGNEILNFINEYFKFFYCKRDYAEHITEITDDFLYTGFLASGRNFCFVTEKNIAQKYSTKKLFFAIKNLISRRSIIIPNELQQTINFALGYDDYFKEEPQTPTNNPILPPELSTPEAMKYWKKAQEAGLVDEHYQWLKTKVLLACFAKEMSDRFDLGKGANSDGSKRINWKIFENLFGESNLRGALNDLKKTGDNPLNINLVNDIFK